MANAAAVGFLAGGLLHCVVNAATAADTIGGTLAVSTEYVYRGISQSRDEPALQASAYWRPAPGWSAGVWLSTMERIDGDAGQEFDLYIARSWSPDPDWLARVMLTHYTYPGDGGQGRYEYDELSFALSYQQRVTASLSWSPNTSRYRYGYALGTFEGRAWTYELSVQQPIVGAWSVFAGSGYYDLRELFDRGYWYWNGGVAFAWERLQIDLSHVGADSTARELFSQRRPHSKWAASLSWRF